ncbi:MAG TPA: hypothetical protein VJQ25_01345, partial [Nitrospira sp.]|nr:hypothetical protein [Nitrospira sp.]
MNPTGQSRTSIAAAYAVTILATVIMETIGAEATMPTENSSTDLDDATAIALAMSAGPADITRSATIVQTDAQGNTVVLREG